MKYDVSVSHSLCLSFIILVHIIFIMSTFNLSTMIPRASLPLRAWRNANRVSQITFRARRDYHLNIGSKSAARSSASKRPILDTSASSKLPSRNSFPGTNMRSIFIQTENTPNADVGSQRVPDSYRILTVSRPSSSFPITKYFQKNYRVRSSNICRPGLHWHPHILLR